MAEINRWREYARRLGFPLPDEAEKDYLQEIMLRELYSITGNELVFRGGTAISKVYSSGRFSEDLDFVLNATADKITVVKKVEQAIKNMNSYFDTAYAKEVYRDMIEYTVSVRGPLYTASGREMAKQRISIDINTYEKCLDKADFVQRMPIYDDIGTYSLLIESKAELLADKVKAAIERRAKHKTVFVRDIYDMWFLITKYALKIDTGLVTKKMKRYGTKEFDTKDIQACVEESKRYWAAELGRFLINVPDYGIVNKAIMDALR